MLLGLKRTALHALAQSKIDDAKLLLANGRFSNAYYLAGHAVELGIKACIARQIAAETIPDKAFINDIYRHDLKHLVTTAGLLKALKDKQNSDSGFSANWAIAAEWTPEKRYEMIDPVPSQLLVRAIDDDQSGVLPWIKTYW